jgi:hypothetical protein
VQNDSDFSRSGWVSVQEGVVFLAVALSAALYVTDPSAAGILQAMVLPIIDFFYFVCSLLLACPQVWWQKLSGRSDKLGSSL